MRWATVLLLCGVCAAQLSVMGGHAVAGGKAILGSSGAILTTVDVVIHCNTSTVGTQITATILANCTDNQSLLAAWSPPTNVADFTLGASANSLISGFTVRSNSDIYTSTSSGKTISQSNAHGFTGWAQTGIPATHKATTVAGYINFAPPSTGGGNTLWDYVSLQSIDGHNSVVQLRTGGTQGSPACSVNAYVLEIETNPGGVTTHSTCITITPATTYWVSLTTNSTTGNSDMYVYSLAPLTLIGHVTSSFGITNSDMAAITLGNNESGTAAVTSTFQWFVFDWTNALSPITP